MDKERTIFKTETPAETENSDTTTKPTSKRRKRILGKAAVEVKQPKPEEVPERPKQAKSEESWLAQFTEKPKDNAGQAEKAPDTSETVSEAEAPADGTLSPQEKETVILVKAQEAAQELASHEVPADPEAAYVDMKLAEYYEELQNNPDIEAVANQVITEEGIGLPAETSEPSEAGTSESTEPEQEHSAIFQDEELLYVRTNESSPPLPEDESEENLSGTVAGAGVPPSTPPTPVAAGHGGGLPPHTAGYGGPGGPYGPAGGFAPHFNMAPPITPNTARQPVQNERFDDRGNPAVFFVAGGIIGYLIGRRRGRIKTEKKLLPIQKKLEKQVEDLHWQIKAKESQIRKVAAEKVRQDGPAVVEALAAKRATKAEKPTPAILLPNKAERFKEGRQKAPEANILHTTKAPEHIGQMLMSGEIPATIIPYIERPASKPGKVELKPTAEIAVPALSEKTVETLNRAQLLQLSERIVVEGSSLRQIYETNLVGEKGLRRLVAEHLRGGDMSKALRREITEREIDFERDPVMRDIAPTGGASAGSGGDGSQSGGQATLDQMLEKAAASLPAATEEAAFYKARAAYEAEQSSKQNQRQQVIDASFAGIIFILLGAVIYLFITRG